MTSLQSFLQDQGVPAGDIAAASAEGPKALHLLAVNRVLLPQGRDYTLETAAERAGITVDEARRLWRAMGFPDLDPGERAFADADVELFKAVRSMVDEGVTNPEAALQVARVTGQCLARIAEAQIGTLRDAIEQPLRAADASDREIAERITEVADQSLPGLESILVRVWRRQLFVAAERAAASRYDLGTGGETLGVGFADLVGFTETSEMLDDDELAQLIGRFEAIAFDSAAAHNARVVKIVGDEVMFVTPDPCEAATMAADLVDACATDTIVPDVRVGLAHGTVVPLEGDFFGPTVNVASRLVELARPASVLASDDFHNAVNGSPAFVWKKLRLKRLKGIGRVPVWSLRREPAESDTANRSESARR